VQALLAYGMAALLAGVSLAFARQQIQTLRRSRAAPTGLDDPPYERRRARLRLLCCGLMLILAGMVAGTDAFGLEERADALIRVRQAERATGAPADFTPEQRHFGQIYSAYWIALLLLLFAVVLLAALDLWGIRRYRRRHLQRLRADRNAMLAQEVVVLRSQRNGHL
jgi:hypothetical protein